MKDQIIYQYKNNKKTLHAFRERVVNLITDLLLVQEITTHQIVGRTKTLDSLTKKIDDKGEKYTCLDDITDIVGIRIITYMESDVDAVSELIEKEFTKDTENSIDKRRQKADQFGYRSLHIVVTLNDSRTKLKEYKRYKTLKCEIQVRSILQHAWAVIEHDLGYKGEVSIPEPYKRSFNRLSALLETADIEFDRLKSELSKYEKDIPEYIKSDPEIVDINKASINSFINSNNILIKARKLIEASTEKHLIETENFDVLIKAIKYSGFNHIGELAKELNENEDEYLNFVKNYCDKRVKGRAITKIAPMGYFMHFLAAKSQDINHVINYHNHVGFHVEEDEANRLIQSYQF